MKNLNKFAFYYTTIVLTILGLGSLFFFESPYNLIQPLVLAPSILFFWLRITDPESASEGEWSFRLIVVAIVLAGLGITGYYLSSSQTRTIDRYKEQIAELETMDPESASISAELRALKKELSEIRVQSEVATPSATTNAQEIADILASLDTPESNPTTPPSTVSLGKIQIKSSTQEDVYASSNTSSKIVGIAQSGTLYDFYESFGDWYLIELSEDNQGWIEASNVSEVN